MKYAERDMGRGLGSYHLALTSRYRKRFTVFAFVR